LFGAAVVAVAGVVACSDGITEPEPRLEALLEAGEAVELPVLTRTTPSPARTVGGEVSMDGARARRFAWGWIGRRGGELGVGDVQLRFPAGAVDRPTLMAMYVPEGPYVQAHLYPHGLQFHRTVELEFSLDSLHGFTAA